MTMLKLETMIYASEGGTSSESRLAETTRCPCSAAPGSVPAEVKGRCWRSDISLHTEHY